MAATETRGEGRVTFALAGEETGLVFPVTVRGPRGQAVVPGGEPTTISFAADDQQLQRLEIGDRSLWVRIASDAPVRLSAHPCCGIAHEGGSLDPAVAVCVSAGSECPRGRHRLVPGLADDLVCPEQERCILDAEVRFVEDGDGSTWEIRHAAAGSLGRTSAAGAATYRSAPCNIGNVLELEIVGSAGQANTDALALDMGWRYTVRIDDGRVAAVTRDGPRTAEVTPAPAATACEQRLLCNAPECHCPAGHHCVLASDAGRADCVPDDPGTEAP